jgi:hypothetical protein
VKKFHISEILNVTYIVEEMQGCQQNWKNHPHVTLHNQHSIIDRADDETG